MNYFKIMLFATAIGLFANSCQNGSKGVQEEPFKYLADEFADIKIIRYQIPGWDSLTIQQKEYIYHLSEAAKSGRDILWDQNFKYGLKIRKVLETILDNYQGDKNSEETGAKNGQTNQPAYFIRRFLGVSDQTTF